MLMGAYIMISTACSVSGLHLLSLNMDMATGVLAFPSLNGLFSGLKKFRYKSVLKLLRSSWGVIKHKSITCFLRGRQEREEAESYSVIALHQNVKQYLKMKLK